MSTLKEKNEEFVVLSESMEEKKQEDKKEMQAGKQEDEELAEIVKGVQRASSILWQKAKGKYRARATYLFVFLAGFVMALLLSHAKTMKKSMPYTEPKAPAVENKSVQKGTAPQFYEFLIYEKPTFPTFYYQDILIHKPKENRTPPKEKPEKDQSPIPNLRDKLRKASIPELREYLKKRGATCHSCVEKEHLVDRIMSLS